MGGGKILDLMRKEVHRLHRRLKKEKSDENKASYNTAQNNFNRTIDKLKENNWKTYLLTLTHDTLF